MQPMAFHGSTLNAQSSAADCRHLIRSGAWGGLTAGLAARYVQVNLVMLPAAEAGDFLRFAQRNPKPCPVLAVSEPGEFALPEMGDDIDLRRDVPRYRIFEDGQCMAEVGDIVEIWRDDLVTFAIGCSFTFEHTLLEAGIAIRHLDEGRNVPMYRTSIQTHPAGRFGGGMVVTMRPLKAVDAIRAIQITSRFPGVHGAPVHLGDPALIGIADLSRPDFGDAVTIAADELPVFWACGATPQIALLQAKPSLCITHAPGHMLITDRLNHDYATL
ncbi:putative hydro-lyase [Herbaspirillum chlorophenolicum]|uniref:putative hydro-lyase n=1 Tax=Herbaspirillum chlorophenolicum TaxID=211589 RepID=UPI00067C57BC|nr:putative hydro-lyase [Herbaspirillum chlorophenolicum]